MPNDGYTPDPADVKLVADAWRNAPCPKCGSQRMCRCLIDDDALLRNYRAISVLRALAAAGRLRMSADADYGGR